MAGFVAGVGSAFLRRNLSRHHVLQRNAEQFTSGAVSRRIRETHPEALPGERWDIGTGVSGHVWKTVQPRAAVLFTPGYHDYPHRYALFPTRTIPRMLGEHLNVYAFDMWGSGYSPGRRGYTVAADAVRDHLAARAIIEQDGLPLFLMGHSLGGLVALASAIQRPAGVAGLVLLSPAIRPRTALPATLALQALATVAPSLTGPFGQATARDVTRDIERQQQMAKDPVIVAGGIPFGVASSIVTTANAVWRGADRLTMPMLVIQGTADPIIQADVIDRYFRATPSPDVTIHLIPGMLHSPLDDFERAGNRAEIMRWFASHIGHEQIPPDLSTTTPWQHRQHS